MICMTPHSATTESKAAAAAMRVREAVAILNGAMHDAALLGVKTEIDVAQVQMIGAADRCMISANLWVPA